MSLNEKNQENMNSIEKTKEKDLKKKRREWPVVFLLFILILLTTLLVLWRLGYFADRYMGRVIDTIVVSPEQSEELPLALCGRVYDEDGKPMVGYEMQLHSTVKYNITDADGGFFYTDCEYGKHMLQMFDADGEEVASAVINIDRSDAITDGKQMFSVDTDGNFYLTLPLETLLVEFDIVFNKETGALRLQQKFVTAFTTQAWVYTYYGIVQASENGEILTAHGSLMLTDGTIWMHNGGVILTDGTYINKDGEVYKNGQRIGQNDLLNGYVLDLKEMKLITPNGSVIYLQEEKVVLPNGVVVKSDGTITYPDGTIVDNRNGLVITPGGYVIDQDGNLTGPNGEKIEGTTLPDGTVINPDGSITTPGGYDIYKPTPGHGYIIDTDSDTPSRPIGEDGDSYAPPSSGDNNGSQGGNDNGQGGNDSGNSQGTAVTEDNGLYVFDSNTNKKWRQLSTVDLFKDGGLIYPGATGTYDFYIRNGVDGTVRFTMNIEEAYHEAGAIPLEYRLKDKNGYVAGTENGTWLSAEELKEVVVSFKVKGNIHYSLEWRWPYERGETQAQIDKNDPYDTNLGTEENCIHYIYVTIHAEAE